MCSFFWHNFQRNFFLHSFSCANMNLNPTQSCTNRVHICNLSYGVSKRVLVEIVAVHCGFPDVPMQIIRKQSMWSHGFCSAIFGVPSPDDVQHCIRALNALEPAQLELVLGQGATSLQAKEAYAPGARLLPGLGRGTSSSSRLLPAPPQAPPPVHLLPTPVLRLIIICSYG